MTALALLVSVGGEGPIRVGHNGSDDVVTLNSSVNRIAVVGHNEGAAIAMLVELRRSFARGELPAACAGQLCPVAVGKPLQQRTAEAGGHAGQAAATSRRASQATP